MRPQLRVEGRCAVLCRGFLQRDIVKLDGRVRQQIVGAELRHRNRQVRPAELEGAADRNTVRVTIGIADRRGDARGEFVRQVDAARPQILVQIRKGDRRIAAVAAEVVDELVSGRVLIGGQVGADIGKTTLIGRFALRIGKGAANVDLDAIEIKFGHELRIDQLALEPRRILLQYVAVRLVAVGAEAKPRLLERVADVKVGPAELVTAKLEAEAEQAVHDDAVVGDNAVVTRLRIARQILVQRGLLERVARAPLVADSSGGDDAKFAVGQGYGRAAGNPRRPVDRDMVILLEQRRFGIDQFHLDRFQIVLREIGAFQDRFAAVQRGLQQRRNVARAVVESGPVGVAAIIGIA